MTYHFEIPHKGRPSSPCDLHCTERSATCHATCSKYKEYESLKDQYYKSNPPSAETFPVTAAHKSRKRSFYNHSSH